MTLQVSVPEPKLPLAWTLSRLGYEATIKARLGWKGLKADEYVDDGYVFLSTPNIKGQNIDFENVNYITEERYLESPEIMLQEGDVLLAKDGSTLGIANVVRRLPAPATVNSSIAVIRPRSNLDSRFLVWFFQSTYIQSVIRQVKDGMGVPHLFQADIRQFPVFYPTIGEQHAIADFLDRRTKVTDDFIQKKERLIELLQEKRQALITQAVTKGLDPTAPMKGSGIEWLGRIPAHWEVLRLKFLKCGALQYGANEAANIDDPDLPRFVRITDIATDGSLRDETFRSLPEDVALSYLLEEGDILLARSGATVGKAFIYKRTWGRACFAGYLIRVRCNQRHVIPNYLYYYTQSTPYTIEVQLSTIQATIQNVSAEKYAEFRVPLPPINEQREIVALLSAELNRIAEIGSKVMRQIDLLREYRQALISAAVTGKIDVTKETAC